MEYLQNKIHENKVMITFHAMIDKSQKFGLSSKTERRICHANNVTKQEQTAHFHYIGKISD